MQILIIVTIYVLICAKTVLDKKQIEKTYVVCIFLQTRNIKQDIKKTGTIQKYYTETSRCIKIGPKCSGQMSAFRNNAQVVIRK